MKKNKEPKIEYNETDELYAALMGETTDSSTWTLERYLAGEVEA